MGEEICNSLPATCNLSVEIDGYAALQQLALDMRWSWSHATDDVWRKLDPVLWKLTHNPWVILQTVSRDRLEKMLADPIFRQKVDALTLLSDNAASQPQWFQKNHPDSPLTGVAYFSMEYMLSEALPIYSGGLGNVAGDQLKAYSDLGIPVVGVGLLYQQGYFRQEIDKDGLQQALFPYNDPGQLPVMPLRRQNGEWLRLEIVLPGYSIWIRTWQVQVGRVKLYLLDSNDAANAPVHRGITSELYGGGPELRLKQEMLLGIGGWRLLNALGIKPDVCHLNEGHAAFAVLERAYCFMLETAQPFEVALAVTRAGNIFTTHTAVAAGFDCFTPSIIEQYLGAYAENKLKIPLKDLLALGRVNPNNASEGFTMAYLAIRGSGTVNGVSRLHGKVSRKIFEPLFSGWPQDEVPVSYVTNGVHMPSWDSAAADDLWTTVCGKDRWLGTMELLEEAIRGVSDNDLWNFRVKSRMNLVDYARWKLSMQMNASGATSEDIAMAEKIFDPNALTIGFARRFATYKRPNLLLHDPERLLRILNNKKRPVQLIIAGKAHPADKDGQQLIKEWIHFIRRSDARSHVIFLSDYDMHMTEHLVQGVDVWINTPKRPWEACGTSGMKVLVNGGINLSEMDGWWAEAYTSDVGWALGDGREHGNDPVYEATEAEQLYTILENEVVPEFYQRNSDGIPNAWVKRMRESMARLTPQFSANRTVRDYTERHYIPAAVAYRLRAAGNSSIGSSIVKWNHDLNEKWGLLTFGNVSVTSNAIEHIFDVEVYLNGLDPDSVSVQLYAEGKHDGDSILLSMHKENTLQETTGISVYHAVASAERPPEDFTVRIIPNCTYISIPLEQSRILWQR